MMGRDNVFFFLGGGSDILSIPIGIIFADFAVFQKIRENLYPRKKFFGLNCENLYPRKRIRQTLISENFDTQSLVSVLSCEKRI